MDELLKSYAAQRRKAGEPQLHPATRQMLQEEVRRVYPAGQGSAPEGGAKNWLARFWPQFALGAIACIALVFGLISLEQRTHRKTELAEAAPPAAPEPKQVAALKSETVNEAKVPVLAEPDVAPAADPSRSLAETEMAQPPPAEPSTETAATVRAFAVAAESPLQTPATLPETMAGKDGQLLSAETPALAQSNPQTTTVLTAPGTPILAKEETKLAQATDAPVSLRMADPRGLAVPITAQQAVPAQVLRAQTTAAQAPPAQLALRQQQAVQNIARSPQVSPAFGDAYLFAVSPNEIKNLGAAKRTYFISVTNSAFYGARPATTPVLSLFQMDQLGDQIRFTDADGSIYDGTLAPQTNAAARGLVARRLSPDASTRGAYRSAALAPQAPPSTNWSFAATGWNQTLGSRIVFQGDLSSPLPQTEDQNSTAPPVQMPVAGRVIVPGKTNLRASINGAAIIGNTNQIPIQAIARPR